MKKRARDLQVSASVTLSYIVKRGEGSSAAAIEDVILKLLFLKEKVIMWCIYRWKRGRVIKVRGVIKDYYTEEQIYKEKWKFVTLYIVIIVFHTRE